MRKKNKKLLFSITKKDFTIQTFKSGGKGGQHQNKKTAFERLTKSGKFKIWISRKVSEIDLGKTIEQQVEEDMKPHNLKVEVKDDNGKWSIE
jgi:hypothetical protein